MSDYSQWEEVGYWYDEGESSPPTMEDWEWYVAHVMVVQDRPPAVNRQSTPMVGQMTFSGAFSDVPIPCRYKCGSLTTTGICANCAADEAENYDPRDDSSPGVW